jgi:uncharacterized Zn finger protein
MSKQVKMICSVCGNDQFALVDENIEDLFDAPDETEIKCSDCGHVVTKEILIEENAEGITAHMDEFKKEIVKKFEKEFNKFFK